MRSLAIRESQAVRHLLTHSGGVGYWRRPDLLQPGVGSGNRAGRTGAPPWPAPIAGLPVEVVSLRCVAARARRGPPPSGHRLRAARAWSQAVADREFVTPGGCGVYASTAEMAPLPARSPGAGLGAGLRVRRRGRPTAWSATAASCPASCPTRSCPDDGLGVVVFSNTGGWTAAACPSCWPRSRFAACWGFRTRRSAPISPAPRNLERALWLIQHRSRPGHHPVRASGHRSRLRGHRPPRPGLLLKPLTPIPAWSV
jgi:hypothetical protein